MFFSSLCDKFPSLKKLTFLETNDNNYGFHVMCWFALGISYRMNFVNWIDNFRKHLPKEHENGCPFIASVMRKATRIQQQKVEKEHLIFFMNNWKSGVLNWFVRFCYRCAKRISQRLGSCFLVLHSSSLLVRNVWMKIYLTKIYETFHGWKKFI